MRKFHHRVFACLLIYDKAFQWLRRNFFTVVDLWKDNFIIFYTNNTNRTG